MRGLVPRIGRPAAAGLTLAVLVTSLLARPGTARAEPPETSAAPAAPEAADTEPGAQTEAEVEPSRSEAERTLRALVRELETVSSTRSSTTAAPGLDLDTYVDTSTEGEPPTEDVQVVAPGPRRVSLVLSAESGGVGGERFVFTLYEKLPSAARELRVESAVMHHGVVAQGPHLIFAPDRRAATLVEFFDGSPVRCDVGAPVAAFADAGERLFPIGTSSVADRVWPDVVAHAPRLRVLDARLRHCQNADGVAVTWLGPAGTSQAEVDWNLAQFEWRRGLRLVVAQGDERFELEDIPFPKNMAARRFRLLDGARRGPGARLFVDAGEFVDGSSRLSSTRVSSLRPLAFEMLSRLRPAALVPGASELAFGPAQLVREARAAGLEYVATNWRAVDPELQLPASRVVGVETPEGSVRLAFLGIIDPALAKQNPLVQADGVQLEEPLLAIEREVTRLRALPERPDVVVLLTTAPPALIEQLRRESREVDVLLAGGLAADERLERSAQEVAPPEGVSDGPVVVPLTGVVESELVVSPLGTTSTLLSIATVYARTRSSVPPDSRVLEVLSRRRAELFPRYDHPLVSGWSGAPLRAVGDDEWRQLVCETVRRGTGADVVFLPALPHVDAVPGPLTELVVAERLAVGDRLVVDHLGGDALRSLLATPPESIAIVCGAELGNDPQLGGRPVNRGERYRLVTTDRAAQLGLDELLGGFRRGRVFDGGGFEPVLLGGEPAALRDLVLATLRAARQPGGAPITTLLERGARLKAPAWYLFLDGLALRLERFQGADAAVFSSVPDQLARSPSSLTLGASADARLAYDADALALELRSRLRYQRLAVTDAEARETDDNLRFALAASLPNYTFETGPLVWMPFVETQVDTELTAGDGGATAAPVPRRLELSGTGGLSLKEGPLARLRVGAQVVRDYSRSARPTKVGLRVDGELSRSPGPLKLSLRFESNLYAPVEGEDASDLRVRALVEGKATLSLVRFLGIVFNVQALAFSGAVPTTSQAALAIRLGVSLELSGVFRL